MDETIELIVRARHGDKDARDTVVSDNLRLVWSIVRRFGNRGHELEDLYQIGCIGLIKAIDKFDTNYDVKFSTYAVPMIMGEIKRFLRDDGPVKVSRTLKEIAGKAATVHEELLTKYSREPTTEEVAKEIGIVSEELVMALESRNEVESIYKTIYQNDGNAIYLIDKLESEENESEKILTKMTVYKAMDELEEVERNLIIKRYYMDKTQMQVAKELGISQVQVSRMEKKILKNMREYIGEDR